MSVTLESVERINALKQGIEATTGESYADLTSGVQALKNGYGQSGGGGTEEIENLIDHFNKSKYVGQDLFRDYPHATFPHIDFSTTTGLIRCFYNSQITSFDYYINSKSATNVSLMFADMKYLVSMVGINTSNATNINGTFSGCVLLETIQEPLDFSKATNIGAVFTGCFALKNVLFAEESIKTSIAIPSPVLSAESKDSIINGLAYVTTAQTLTVSKNAGFTAEHKATAQSKGWTVVEQ